MVNKKNPFAFKAKQETKKKSGGKRIGKSKPDKANNQLMKLLSCCRGRTSLPLQQDANLYFSTKAKSSCFFSRLARATLMVTGSPKLNFL